MILCALRRAQKRSNYMGLLGKLFGISLHYIGAPVSGKAIPLHEVNDPAFAAGLLGKGIAIQPVVGSVFAPCDAKVDMLFETGHAVTLVTDFGAEILIHIGLDTVNLKGKYYTPQVKTGDTVKKGQLLIEFDLQAIKDAGYDSVTPMVICNSADYRTISTHTGVQVRAGEAVVKLSK